MRPAGWASVAVVILGAAVAVSLAQTPTQGPAARAGAALDKALLAARDELAEAVVKAKVRVALLEQLGTDALRLSADVAGTTVTLTGEVSRRASQELAVRVASAVSGVSAVENRLEVVLETQAETPLKRAVDKAERELADGLLQAKVKARLLDQVGRVGFGIEVAVANGVVTLSGTVPDAVRRDLAVQAATHTDRVKSVRNRLTIEKK